MSADIQDLLSEITASVSSGIPNDSGSGKQQLLQSITKLQRAIETPEQYVQRLRMQPLQHVAFNISDELGILAAVDEQIDGISSAQLASRLRVNEALIIRVMRMLTALGISEEAGPRSYRSNAEAKALLSRGSRGGLKIQNWLTWPVTCKIREYVQQPAVRESADYLADNGPLEYTFGQHMWQLLKENPRIKEAFDDNMAGRNAVHKIHWYEKYPAEERLALAAKRDPKSVFLVDVAGNQGYDIVSFRQKFPDLPGRCILQDLPETLQRLESPLTSVETMEYNFFTLQPIKGARAYYFHNIFHDWSDNKSREILSNTANSMDKDYSRLLIDDMVLADVGERLTGAEMDLLMMLLPSGLERSLGQWERLLASVEPPLEIEKVWSPSEEYQAVIECRLK